MYAEPSDMLERYDANDIGDLVSDDGTQVSSTLLLQNVKLISALNDASGEIDAALFAGNRYTPTQLASLQGHSRSHLIRITCDLAMARLLQRRPGRDPEKLKSFLELTAGYLKDLRLGANVFAIATVLDAGNIEATGLSVVDYSTNGLIRDRTRNYYPARPVSPYQG